MRLYQILVQSKDGKSWFFVMNLYESRTEAEAVAKLYKTDVVWRIVSQDVVVYG